MKKIDFGHELCKMLFFSVLQTSHYKYNVSFRCCFVFVFRRGTPPINTIGPRTDLLPRFFNFSFRFLIFIFLIFGIFVELLVLDYFLTQSVISRMYQNWIFGIL
jgi:hypothetical protein